jgi:hypothetical protein
MSVCLFITSITVVSSTGMHLGEKGFWNKWSLFDESTRVPLIVADPWTPPAARGQHYRHPVELLDLFPTLLDLFPHLVHCPPPVQQQQQGRPATCLRLEGEAWGRYRARCPPVVNEALMAVKCPHPQGKSLLRVLQASPPHRANDLPLAPSSSSSAGEVDSMSYKMRYYAWRLKIPFFSTLFTQTTDLLPKLNMTFAISQVLKCAKITDVQHHADWLTQLKSPRGPDALRLNITNPWRHCATSSQMTSEEEIQEEISVMGYSFRSLSSQYIIWVRYDRIACSLALHEEPYAEEYYQASRGGGDIRNVNVLKKVDVAFITRLRKLALSVLKKKRFFKFRNCFRKRKKQQ